MDRAPSKLHASVRAGANDGRFRPERSSGAESTTLTVPSLMMSPFGAHLGSLRLPRAAESAPPAPNPAASESQGTPQGERERGASRFYPSTASRLGRAHIGQLAMEGGVIDRMPSGEPRGWRCLDVPGVCKAVRQPARKALAASLQGCLADCLRVRLAHCPAGCPPLAAGLASLHAWLPAWLFCLAVCPAVWRCCRAALRVCSSGAQGWYNEEDQLVDLGFGLAGWAKRGVPRGCENRKVD